MTDQRRLARLLADLAVQGVSFRVEAGQIRITGMEAPDWLPGWLERHQTDLLLLLGCPRRPAEPQARPLLFEDSRPAWNDLSIGADRPRPLSRDRLLSRLESFALD